MIARPSILYLYATFIALVLVVAFWLTPIRSHGSRLDFWWARIAPVGYAKHAIQTAEFFYTSYNDQTCPDRQDNIQGWRTLVDAQPNPSELRQLLAASAPAGRLYLLAALFRVDSVVPLDLLAEMQRDSSVAEVWDWATEQPWRRTLSELVSPDSIEQWAARLMEQPRVGEMESCAS
jgi:hypothetical protein